MAEHVQAAADLHLLQLAEVAVQLRERRVVVVGGLDPAVAVQPDVGGQGQDLLAQHLQPARVHPGGLEVLVDQQLQLRQRAVGPGPGQRRREMVDDDRLRPPLGLGALAGVVDDERVEVGQGSEGRLRKAGLAERQRLARQPFEIAVLPHVDDGVDVLHGAQPCIERQVAVRRRQVRIVVARLGVDVVAARRLQPDHRAAAAKRRQGEPAGGGEVERILPGVAPAFVDEPAYRLRQRIEVPPVGPQLQGHRDLAAVRRGVGRPAAEPFDQPVTVAGDVRDRVTRPFEGAQ